jgi:TRAP-type transport system small permease protein
MDLDDAPKVMGDDGEFHAQDEAVDLSHTTIEGWVALAIFWALGGVVFYQFVTRYVMNNHIQVDLLYRWLPAKLGRVMALSVDVIRIAFFATMVVLTAQMMQKMDSYQMTIIDLPMNIVYGVCLFGFAMMAVRSVWVMKVHWQRGYSVLERPETTMDDR